MGRRGGGAGGQAKQDSSEIRGCEGAGRGGERQKGWGGEAGGGAKIASVRRALRVGAVGQAASRLSGSQAWGSTVQGMCVFPGRSVALRAEERPPRSYASGAVGAGRRGLCRAGAAQSSGGGECGALHAAEDGERGQLRGCGRLRRDRGCVRYEDAARPFAPPRGARLARHGPRLCPARARSVARPAGSGGELLCRPQAGGDQGGRILDGFQGVHCGAAFAVALSAAALLLLALAAAGRPAHPAAHTRAPGAVSCEACVCGGKGARGLVCSGFPHSVCK
mmetsp:Transcript_19917/g.44351  ORF Transcript_19917/g.44351 Transcript_19917/m.44351 type:complete len:279 (-) Transcript_19917:57-893(-)